MVYWELLFHYFDPNNDGAITYGEFTWVINNRRSIASKKGKGLQFNAEVKTNKGSSKNLKADVEATQKSMHRLNVAVGENNPFFRDQKVNKQNKSTYDIKRYVWYIFDLYIYILFSREPDVLPVQRMHMEG